MTDDLYELDGDEGVLGYVKSAPLEGFLSWLAAGWQLPFIVEPMGGSHGAWSILLTRTDGV